MKRLALALGTGLMLLGLLPGSTLAAPVLDQSNGTGTSYTGGATFTQTFTAGKTGALVEVDLYLGMNGTETDNMSIQNVDGSSLPDGTILASSSASVTGTNISDPAWVEFSFSTPASVASGTQYAIVVTTTDAQIYGTTGDGYSGGAAWEWVTSQGLSYWVGFGENLGDFSFRTYVDADAALSSPSVSPTPFESFQGRTAVATTNATPPPTNSAPVGDAGNSGPATLLIVASFAAAAAIVTLRRYGVAGR